MSASDPNQRHHLQSGGRAFSERARICGGTAVSQEAFDYRSLHQGTPPTAPPTRLGSSYARAHLACLRFGPLALLVLATYACHLSRARARPHKAVLPCLRHHGVRSLNFFGALELPNASRVALSRCTRWNRFRYVTGQSLRIGAASSKHTSPSLLRMWKRLELQWARCGAEQETRITTWQLTVSL